VLLATRHSACAAKVSATNQLKALIVGAPEELRAELRGLATNGRSRAAQGSGTGRPGHWSTARRFGRCARPPSASSTWPWRPPGCGPSWTGWWPRWLLGLPGIGPISAAQVLVSWSHAGGLRSEAAFAALAGANPIPASSGQVIRQRLNRSGDRQLNRALHTIVVARLRDDPETRAYAGAGRRARVPARSDGA
jgi:transposase